MKKIIPTVMVMFAIIVVCQFSPSLASDFRPFNPIPSPNIKLPLGAMPVTTIKPVDVRVVEKMVESIIGSWNTFNLDARLGKEFYNKSRLLDTLAVNAPRDAKLRLLSIQGVQTLSQYVMTDPNDNKRVLVSTVSATARTQAEYNDPTRGFRTVEGTNEYVLLVKTRMEEVKK